MSPTTAELFVALRCEELPARYVRTAAAGLEKGVRALLKGIEHGEVRTWASPRRIAVAVSGVAAARPLEEKLVTGPPEAAAWRDGAWTKGALGFARGKGVDAADLEIIDGPRGRVVAARVTTGGEQTVARIAAGLEAAILGIDFGKTMRWGSGRQRWARPIHGLVALYDGERIDCSVAGVASGVETVGHRLTPGPIHVRSADQWVESLAAHNVMVDRPARKARIEADLRAAAEAVGATVGALDLIDEVVDLVEWPVVVTASFDPELLTLPSRLLVESMGVHQRVFPLFEGAELQARFLVVTNHPYATDPDVAAIIAAGNTKVLAARFYDARFFYAEDRKQPLTAHGADLEKMRWIRNGGTMAEKQARVGRLAARLAPLFGADATHAGRAGALSKCDLATQMVGEFPELQGHVGKLLARHDGEEEAVAAAIEEHYLPRFSSDQTPATPEGRAAAAADRIDTLTGCFHHGLKPKGSADPLGLRRAAVGLVSILLGAGTRVQLGDLLASSELDAGEALLPFVVARLRNNMMERHPTDIVDAVLATGDRDPVALEGRAAAMSALSATADFEPLKQTFKRLANITKDHASTTYAADALGEPAERALHTALDGVRAAAADSAAAGDFAGALDRLRTLKGPVDALFDAVMVMAEDPQVRANRLGLLSAVGAAFRDIADFKHLS